jgi:hypothetical protein
MVSEQSSSDTPQSPRGPVVNCFGTSTWIRRYADGRSGGRPGLNSPPRPIRFEIGSSERDQHVLLRVHAQVRWPPSYPSATLLCWQRRRCDRAQRTCDDAEPDRQLLLRQHEPEGEHVLGGSVLVVSWLFVGALPSPWPAGFTAAGEQVTFSATEVSFDTASMSPTCGGGCRDGPAVHGE